MPWCAHDPVAAEVLRVYSKSVLARGSKEVHYLRVAILASDRAEDLADLAGLGPQPRRHSQSNFLFAVAGKVVPFRIEQA